MKTIKNQIKYLLWIAKGKPTPTPHVAKVKIISEYKKKYDYNILIETGTYLGEMVEAQKDNFKKIISIELEPTLFKNAKAKFLNDSRIEIIEGDSGKVLPKILETIDKSAVFWLDGHYSSGVTAQGDLNCPIFAEIEAIFKAKKLPHVILIDDARLFVGADDYPTKEDLFSFVKQWL